MNAKKLLAQNKWLATLANAQKLLDAINSSPNEAVEIDWKNDQDDNLENNTISSQNIKIR